ncbi:MAG TPA: hypothetical protein VGO87_11025 [Acidimicrobiia bacterium]
MTSEPPSRRRRRKKIVRRDDGSLFDATERRRITPAELRDYVRDGGLFEARRQGSGTDCTYEVLQSVLGASMLQNLVPGLGSGPLAGLGLGGGGGPLGALAGAGGLADLARLLGDEARRRSSDYDDDEWDGPRRGRRPADDRDWRDGNRLEEEARPSGRRDKLDWADEPDFD